MKNVLVYCEIYDGEVASISKELLSAGKKLAEKLGVRLEAMAFSSDTGETAHQVAPYGTDTLYVAEDSRLAPYSTLPHAELATYVIRKYDPQIVLFGATSTGRDLAPRVASAVGCGLTADTTVLDIGDHYVSKEKKTYHNLLYAIRPAFGGSIMANIINWEMHPQMATVREGVMKNEIFDKNYTCETVHIPHEEILNSEHFVVEILKRETKESKVNLKEAPIIIAGGYGVGSKQNFAQLYELAEVLGGEVGGSRAAVDAGFIEHEHQIGQTGVTVRPKLYIAAGISGAVQHTAGMQDSSMIISINTDPKAPINEIADYIITGDLNTVIPRMIKAYKNNTK